MKKILFVAHSGTLEGGGEHSLLDMILHTKSLGLYDIHVALPEPGPFSEALKRHDIPFSTATYKFGMNPRPVFDVSTRHRTSLWFGQSLVSAYNIVTLTKPDLIISNTIVIPWFIRIARFFNVPSICVVRELNDLRNGVDLAPDTDTYLRKIAEQVTAVVFNSKYTQSNYEKYFKHLPQAIVYPVVKVDPKLIEESTTKKPFLGSTIKLVVIGNVATHKNQLLALQAINQLRKSGTNHKFHLTIVGAQRNPDYLETLKSYISKHSLSPYVTFKPYTPNPHREIVKHDILLMTSSHEAFGRVTLEGQMLGRLVIGAASAGTLEIIKNDSTGLTFKPDDSADLADTLLSAADNKRHVQSLAQKSQEQSLRVFSEEAIYAPYNELLASRHFKNQPIDYDTARLFGDDLFSMIKYGIELERDLSMVSRVITLLRPARLVYKAARNPQRTMEKVKKRVSKKRNTGLVD